MRLKTMIEFGEVSFIYSFMYLFISFWVFIKGLFCDQHPFALNEMGNAIGGL